MFRFKVFENSVPPEMKRPPEEEVHVLRKKRGILYREGDLLDNAFLLLKGSVSLSKKHPNGEKVHLKNCQPGNFLGIHRCAGNLMSHSARMSHDCALLSIPISQLSQIQSELKPRETLIDQIIQDIDYFYIRAFSG